MGFIENKQSSKLYLENINTNYVNVGLTSTTLGTLVSIDETKVIKTGGIDLTTLDIMNEAVKIGNEIKRISYVEDADTFYITLPCLSTFTGGENILIDFSSNNSFELSVDNFENQVQPTDLTNNTIVFESCTKFTGCNSVFLYDNSKVREERRESLVTGTYDIDNLEYDNVDKTFVARLNKSLSYIIDMEVFEGDLNEDGEVTVIGKQANIYGVKLNGKILDSSDYNFSGNILTITNNNKLRSYNYVAVYHYPFQNSSILSGVEIKFGIKGFNQTFITDFDILEEFNYFDWRDSFSSTPSYEFYTAKNIDYARNTKIKINKNSTITFNVWVGNDDTNRKNISKHIFNLLSNKNNFRLLKKEDEEDGTLDYWYNCRILDPAPYTQAENANTITYTIEFLEHIRIKPVYFGEYGFGETSWGYEGFRE